MYSHVNRSFSWKSLYNPPGRFLHCENKIGVRFIFNNLLCFGYNFCHCRLLFFFFLNQVFICFLSLMHILFFFLQLEFKWVAGNCVPPNTSPMASAPASALWKSWCVPVSACPCRCSPTGLEGAMEPSTGAGGAPRNGGVSMTKRVPRESSCSAKMGAHAPTRSQWSPPASARGTLDSTTSPVTTLRACRLPSPPSTTESGKEPANPASTAWVRTQTLPTRLTRNHLLYRFDCLEDSSLPLLFCYLKIYAFCFDQTHQAVLSIRTFFGVAFPFQSFQDVCISRRVICI